MKHAFTPSPPHLGRLQTLRALGSDRNRPEETVSTLVHQAPAGNSGPGTTAPCPRQRLSAPAFCKQGFPVPGLREILQLLQGPRPTPSSAATPTGVCYALPPPAGAGSKLGPQKEEGAGPSPGAWRKPCTHAAAITQGRWYGGRALRPSRPILALLLGPARPPDVAVATTER